VVEIGALNRCGDIAKPRSNASRLLEGDKTVQFRARPVLETVQIEPILVLEYLATRIGHLPSRAQTAR
jgi:hypothetical protein